MKRLLALDDDRTRVVLMETESVHPVHQPQQVRHVVWQVAGPGCVMKQLYLTTSGYLLLIVQMKLMIFRSGKMLTVYPL